VNRLLEGVRRFDRNESGQVTFLFVFASIAFVILIAFILNTASQTSRKIQMQGASDSGAVAAGIWMARGMNLMVLNNKGMADILSVMIAIHAAAQTAQQTQFVVGAMAASMATTGAVSLDPLLEALADELADESVAWGTVYSELQSADQNLSGDGGTGWEMMSELDSLNQTIKTAMPTAAKVQAATYAQKNGADMLPYAWLFSGVPGSTPVFPVGRGDQQSIAKQANDCSLKVLTYPVKLALGGACMAMNQLPCVSTFVAWPMFDQIVQQNVSNLETGAPPANSGYFSAGQLGGLTDSNGNSIQGILNTYNTANDPGDGTYKPVTVGSILKGSGFSLGQPLNWPDDPPLPMMLTDNPQPDASAQIDNTGAGYDLYVVRKDLQYLVVALGNVKPPPLGGKQFQNPVPYNKWVTYGEVDVYNGTKWDMYTQNWRVKLSRAVLLNEKWQEIVGVAGLQGVADFTFVNTH